MSTVVNPEWRFTATIERPDGWRIEVDITVPDYKDAGEQSEVAQMAASQALGVRTRLERDARGRAEKEATLRDRKTEGGPF